MTMTESERKHGRVVGIAGPVIDVEFPRGSLPELNHAVEFTVKVEGKTSPVLAEVAQQLGDGRVRAVCMRPTDGLMRGTAVRNTGHGITVPVGETGARPRVERVGRRARRDRRGFDDIERWEIHRPAPDFDALEPSAPHVRDRHQGHRPAHARTSPAARSVCSVAPASARPCSSPR